MKVKVTLELEYADDVDEDLDDGDELTLVEHFQRAVDQWREQDVEDHYRMPTKLAMTSWRKVKEKP